MAKNSNQNNGLDSSWIPVFIMLLIFWPVGLFLLWKKLQQLQNAPAKERRRKPVSAIGIGLATVGFIQLLNIFGSGSAMFGAFALIGGGAMLFMGNSMKQKERKFKKYKAIIGKRKTMPIDDIAAAMPVSYAVACDDLQAMIDDGYFGDGAYLDMYTRYFVADESAAPKMAEVKPHVATKTAPEVRTEPVQGQAARTPAPENTESSIEREFREKLVEIKRVNDAIKDEHISNQIDRIEHVTVNILELIKEQPAKVNQIQTFMNYYLPTTLKLLKAYGQMERQQVPGANITSSMQNIEKMVDQLVWAFEQQLDNLFEADALDISSDIKVLEKMMAKDGLSENNYTLPKLRPGGAAAQPFEKK